MAAVHGNGRTRKITVNNVIDWIFYALYIALIIVTILDMCGIPIPFVDKFTSQDNKLLRFMLIIFATVGIVVLKDKRELAKNVTAPLSRIENLITNGTSNDSNFVYFSNKDLFYLYFTEEITRLGNGAEVLVTAFDKNQGLHYYTGENKHIEAFMDDWSKKIESNSINVKQILHVFTKKEFGELKERIERFKNCYNFSLGVIVGMPIRPYIDFVVINKSTVMLNFPNDKVAPYDTAFGVAIRSTELATEFEKYFNIYWNDDCRIIKDRDGINSGNLKYIEILALQATHFSEYKEYNVLLMQLIANSASYKNLNRLIGDLHCLSINYASWLPHRIAVSKIEKIYNEIHNKIMLSSINIRASDIQENMSILIAGAQHQIRATSVEIGDDAYWTSKNGESIFSLNIRGITDKGIEISRIFIMNSDQTDSLSETIQRQQNAGVKVSKIVTEMRARGSYKDFIIIDDKAVIEIFADGNAKMYIGEEKIQKYIQQFETYMQQVDK